MTLGLVAGLGAGRGSVHRRPRSPHRATPHWRTRHHADHAGQDITLLELPVNPKPNTHLTTDLSDVLDHVLTALDDRPEQRHRRAPGRRSTPASTRSRQRRQRHPHRRRRRTSLRSRRTSSTSPSTSRAATPGAIKVSAIDMRVLPAAEAQMGALTGGGPDRQRRLRPERSGRRRGAGMPPAAVTADRVSAGLETAPGRARARATTPTTGSSLAPSRSCWRAVRRSWSFAGSAAERHTTVSAMSSSGLEDRRVSPPAARAVRPPRRRRLPAALVRIGRRATTRWPRRPRPCDWSSPR